MALARLGPRGHPQSPVALGLCEKPVLTLYVSRQLSGPHCQHPCFLTDCGWLPPAVPFLACGDCFILGNPDPSSRAAFAGSSPLADWGPQRSGCKEAWGPVSLRATVGSVPAEQQCLPHRPSLFYCTL